VADKVSVSKIVTDNVARESRLHTDESRLYFGASEHFASHETVKHSAKEYVRGDVHTNSAEGYFSIFKRGMRGTYQHCAEKHLHRYLAEYDFRYNTRVQGRRSRYRAQWVLGGRVPARIAVFAPLGPTTPDLNCGISWAATGPESSVNIKQRTARSAPTFRDPSRRASPLKWWSPF
jgi:hypothetical protein